jgi:arylsulfatase A
MNLEIIESARKPMGLSFNFATAALFLAVLLTAAPCVSAEPSRPNIVILLADDLGWGDPGCYGATLVKTPNIDRLAAEGMRFTDAHSPASVCTPSRYNLMTGRYAWRTHVGTGAVWDDPLLIETSRLTIASMLKAKGYATGIVGKWHLGLGKTPKNPADWRGMDWNGEIRPGPLEVGFDEAFFRPAIGGPAPQVYVEGHRVAGLDPADPLRTAFPANYPGYLAVKRNATNIGPRVTGGRSAHFATDRTAVVETSKATAFIEAHAGKPFFLYFATHNVHGPITPGERFAGRSTLGKIGDFIEELDWIAGEVMQRLEQKGLAQNTLFIFSSDNGGTKTGNSTGHARNGPWRGFKTEAYEGGHRVPLIIRWPGHVEPGSRSDALVALTDVMATCAGIVGHPLPDNAAEDSISFLPVLEGGNNTLRTSIVCDGWKGDYSIRDGQWKLILPAPDFPGLRATPELYNLGKDPGEQQNVAGQQPETVARLQALLEQIRKNGRSRPPGNGKNTP